jgi:hypothetical protein
MKIIEIQSTRSGSTWLTETELDFTEDQLAALRVKWNEQSKQTNVATVGLKIKPKQN